MYVLYSSHFLVFIVCKQHMSVLSEHHREGRTHHYYSMAQLAESIVWDLLNYSVLVLIQDCYRHTHTLYDHYDYDTQT